MLVLVPSAEMLFGDAVRIIMAGLPAKNDTLTVPLTLLTVAVTVEVSTTALLVKRAVACPCPPEIGTVTVC